MIDNILRGAHAVGDGIPGLFEKFRRIAAQLVQRRHWRLVCGRLFLLLIVSEIIKEAHKVTVFLKSIKGGCCYG